MLLSGLDGLDESTDRVGEGEVILVDATDATDCGHDGVPLSREPWALSESDHVPTAFLVSFFPSIFFL